MTANRHFLVAVALLAALAGCTTVQDQVANDRGGANSDCLGQVNAARPTFKIRAAAYMGVSRDAMPQLFCDRLLEGIAAGRINQSDINKLIRTGQLTSKFSFLRG